MFYIIKQEELYQTTSTPASFPPVTVKWAKSRQNHLNMVLYTRLFCQKYFVPLLFKCAPVFNEFSFYCLFFFFYVFEYRLRQVPTKVA